MKEELQDKIALYYKKLPEKTKVVFSEMKWLETLVEIEKNYTLNDNQIKVLGTNTTLVLLGIINLDQYAKIIYEELGLDENKTEQILLEINDKIIKGIESLLYESFNKNSFDLMPEKGSTVTTENKSSLSEKTQDIFNSSNYQTNIYDIGKKYNLNIEESGLLEEVITKTLDGIYEANLFKILLKERINIDEEKLESLIKEVNENIFQKNRQNLIENSDKRELGEIPIPPYKKEIVDEIPLPPNLKVEEIQNIETEPTYNNEIINVIDEKTIISGNNNSQNINNSMDIVSDKLFKNTVSKTEVTDYSLPKMKKDSYSSLDTGSSVKNPHDPYHEQI